LHVFDELLAFLPQQFLVWAGFAYIFGFGP